jgi:CRP/FNR family transcriptional regulator
MDQSVFLPLHTSTCDVVCSHCNLREICLPVGLSKSELERIDQRLVAVRRRVARGEALFRRGERFSSVFAVWTGFFKTCARTNDGHEQVTGFQMGGELIGLDGIGTGRHEAQATALENSQVCVIPFEELETLSREIPSLQQQFNKVMSREIVGKQQVMLLLGGRNAEERVAAFLLNLSHRLRARGFSGSSVVLRMTREEIGSFLGLSLETVSRTFSKFQADGLLTVRTRQIRITRTDGLQQIIDGATP